MRRPCRGAYAVGITQAVTAGRSPAQF